MAKQKWIKRVWDIAQLIVRPEQCKKCGEWMDLYINHNDGHTVLERLCVKHEEKEESNNEA